MKGGQIEVRVPLQTNARHLQQMYTGLEALEKKNKIRLEYIGQAKTHNDVFTSIFIADKHVVIDCKDSVDIEHESYNECDFYFKRSLSQHDINSRNKLHPFGLYFEVYPSFRSMYTTKRFLSFSEPGFLSKTKSAIKALDTKNSLTFLPREDDFLPSRKFVEDISILFFTRLWDPYFDKEFVLSKNETKDRENINSLRIDCARTLREKFGEDCLVGLMDDEYSRELAPDLVLSREYTSQANYINLVKRAKVCITSTGLHGSIGAKFAEYLSLGKVILSEPFEHVLPVPVEQGLHYFSYTSPGECVNKAQLLLSNSVEYAKMSEANRLYSCENLAPESMMWRIINKVLIC